MEKLERNRVRLFFTRLYFLIIYLVQGYFVSLKFKNSIVFHPSIPDNYLKQQVFKVNRWING